ncbi:MAG: biotin/lipoyl-containing protein [Gemmatimonadota bacterium]|nr:biotin/lipoyl-containing protein [Gemmatimonadota bacterium]
MKYHASLGDESAWVERLPAGLRVHDREVEAELHWLSPDEVLLRYDGLQYRAFVRPTADGWHVQIRGRSFEVSVEDERTRAIRELAGPLASEGGEERLRAPMPGLVVRVLVEAGEHVEAGQPLVVVEAMKMENELRAERAAVVTSVDVEAGRTVERDEVLVSLEAEA